ncbi:MAG: hypothetical protein RL081_2068 [Pseudomonadota bacterium]
MHQCNQGRHHNRDAVARLLPRNGRYLVTQAFSAASGHEHQRVSPGHDVLDDGLLGAAKLLVAKNVTKNLEV